MNRRRHLYYLLNLEVRLLLPHMAAVCAGLLLSGRLLFWLLGRPAEHSPEVYQLFSSLVDRSGQSIVYLAALLLLLFLSGISWQRDLREWRGIALTCQTQVSALSQAAARVAALATGLLAVHVTALAGVVFDYYVLYRVAWPAMPGTFDLWRAVLHSGYLRFLLPPERLKMLLLIPAASLVAEITFFLVMIDAVRTVRRQPYLIRAFAAGIASCALFSLLVTVQTSLRLELLGILVTGLIGANLFLLFWLRRMIARRVAG